MMPDLAQREKKEEERFPFGEPWGWRVALLYIGVGGGLACMAVYFRLCPWYTLYSLGGNHYAAGDSGGRIGHQISTRAACRCIYVGRPFLVMGIILLPIGYAMMFVLIRRMNRRKREKKSGNKTGT